MTTRPNPESKQERKDRERLDKNKKREKYSLAILTATLGAPYSSIMDDVLVETSVNMAEMLINELNKRK